MSMEAIVPVRKSMKVWFGGLEKEKARKFLDYCRFHMEVKSDEAVRQFIRGDKEPTGTRLTIMEQAAKIVGGKKSHIWD